MANRTDVQSAPCKRPQRIPYDDLALLSSSVPHALHGHVCSVGGVQDLGHAFHDELDHQRAFVDGAVRQVLLK
ncbi:hypothetical protein L596_013523 [Steinernema carpocapsae]|uniref:Uncharacterized protein n=1 Tax=Steinernema carpocapsae TaxID=34508 RepID=A0A4U5P0G7_STECR|nr:hypothetical protein L596_013523 [Steinernema carpocapsae]